MTPKQRVAEAALAYVQSGMVLGLGTGSTAECFIDALGAAVKAGRLRDIVAVPTSVASDRQASALGIRIVGLHEHRPDVTVDGADEVDVNLNLIKGLGGALLREKIVAQNSAKMIVIADASKKVSMLGQRHSLPVEVTQFAHESHAEFLRSFGAIPTLRLRDGKAFVTDNANYIYDCRFPATIPNPRDLETRLRARAGIVETGLFIGIASIALIADDTHVEAMGPQK
jgi:ribose 5-phosphate isomerase A